MKIVNWILCFLFFLSAILQFNDPDPVVWMLMWGAAGVVCLFFGLGSLPKIMPISLGLVSFAWALFLLPGIIKTAGDIHWNEVFMHATMSNLTVEWVRELGGLLIISAWMVVLAIKGRRDTA